MKILEYIPATRRVLRELSSNPTEFAEEHGVLLHELAQDVAAASLEFMRSFNLETPAHWFGYIVVEGETQQMVGTCSFKGPPVDGSLEIAYLTFPGFEGMGIGSEMARFLVERAKTLPGVKRVAAHTEPGSSAATRILEKAGLRLTGEVEDQGELLWHWELDLEET